MTTCLKPRCASAPAVQDKAFILQRYGARPLHFRGRPLASAEYHMAGSQVRLRFALYSRHDGGYVTAVSTAYAGRRPACCTAALADNLAEAVRQFEAATLHDTEAPAPDALDCTASLFSAAARLCRQVAQDRALRHAAGRFLHQLCLDWPC